MTLNGGDGVMEGERNRMGGKEREMGWRGTRTHSCIPRALWVLYEDEAAVLGCRQDQQLCPSWDLVSE